MGIDGVTKDEYGRNLEQNLAELVEMLKNKSYKPQPARRVEIPKDNGKTRPLSIYCYEDKLVQEALKRILEAVYEPHFQEEMMGFRPARGCHMAIRKLNGYYRGLSHKYLYVLCPGMVVQRDYQTEAKGIRRVDGIRRAGGIR